MNRSAGGAHLPPPDILQELVTLAHEYGHFRSWKARNRTAAYVAGLEALEVQRTEGTGVMPEEIAMLIRDEETRAWAGGRAVLAELGFDDWAAYDAKEAHGLKQYELIFAGRPEGIGSATE